MYIYVVLLLPEVKFLKEVLAAVLNSCPTINGEAVQGKPGVKY